jgi:hypothetical protein
MCIKLDPRLSGERSRGAGEPSSLTSRSDCVSGLPSRGRFMARLVVLSGGEVGKDEVGAQAGFGAGELGVVPVEGLSEHDGCVGVAEVGEGVAAPPGEVYVVEGEIRPFGEPARQRWEQVVCGVEGAQAGVGLVSGGEGFAVGGGEPGPEQWWATGGDGAGMAGELGGVGRAADVGEHDGLLGEGVGEQGRGLGGASGVAGLPVVPPGGVDLSAVEDCQPARVWASVRTAASARSCGPLIPWCSSSSMC